MKFYPARFMGLVSLAVFLIALSAPVKVHAQTVTIQADSPSVSNCYPFGHGGAWAPFHGFIYQNVPAFDLGVGDAVAFDLGAMNDVDIELQIDMVATTTNGGDVPNGAYTTVVTNTQTPANPRGDAVIGNYELQFTSEGNFSFPGGGLIIRFSNPSANYQLDRSCTEVLVSALATDASGHFVKRFYRDDNGYPPWERESPNAIGGFQVDATGSVVTYSVGGVVSDLTGSVTLQNNGVDDIIKTTNDGFTFTAQAEGSDYAVTVSSQPTGQTCTVTNGSGTNITADITNVSVACIDDVVAPPPVPMVPIPTLSQWALILLTMLLGLMVFANRRRLF